MFSELYEYCVKEKIADANLIAKWKKQVRYSLRAFGAVQRDDIEVHREHMRIYAFFKNPLVFVFLKFSSSCYV